MPGGHRLGAVCVDAALIAGSLRQRDPLLLDVGALDDRDQESPLFGLAVYFARLVVVSVARAIHLPGSASVVGARCRDVLPEIDHVLQRLGGRRWERLYIWVLRCPRQSACKRRAALGHRCIGDGLHRVDVTVDAGQLLLQVVGIGLRSVFGIDVIVDGLEEVGTHVGALGCHLAGYRLQIHHAILGGGLQAHASRILDFAVNDLRPARYLSLRYLGLRCRCLFWIAHVPS